MINAPPYSQRDARWRDKYVGFSKFRFATDGCTVTALSSFLSYVYNEKLTPDIVNEKLKSVNAFSDGKKLGAGALLVWYRVPFVFPKLKYIKRVYNYSNTEVAWYVYGRKTPVMVEVNAASIGAVRHWVLFLGSGKMVDPWTGTIKPTNTYPPTGHTIYQTV